MVTSWERNAASFVMEPDGYYSSHIIDLLEFPVSVAVALLHIKQFNIVKLNLTYIWQNVCNDRRRA